MSRWQLITDKDKEIYKCGQEDKEKEIRETWRCERGRFCEPMDWDLESVERVVDAVLDNDIERLI